MSDDKPSNNVAELIFQLGRLQVYHYPTETDIKTNVNPTAVYWRDMLSNCPYGPFPSIYSAMQHYTHIVRMNQIKKDKKNIDKKDAELIHVDFITKKRVIYALPEGSDV